MINKKNQNINETYTFNLHLYAFRNVCNIQILIPISSWPTYTYVDMQENNLLKLQICQVYAVNKKNWSLVIYVRQMQNLPVRYKCQVVTAV